MTALNVYDWNQIRAALRLLQEVFPGFLENVVLIGGGACWFYREALRQWQDPDYPVPLWTEAEEAVWLSKDVDFMGLDREEASQLLDTPFDEETHTFHFRGLELDFLEEGLRLTPQNAVLNRINAFVHTCGVRGGRADRLRRGLSDIYRRVSTGVHSDVDGHEARYLFLTTYLLLGEIFTFPEILPAS